MQVKNLPPSFLTMGLFSLKEFDVSGDLEIPRMLRQCNGLAAEYLAQKRPSAAFPTRLKDDDFLRHTQLPYCNNCHSSDNILSPTTLNKMYTSDEDRCSRNGKTSPCDYHLRPDQQAWHKHPYHHVGTQKTTDEEQTKWGSTQSRLGKLTVWKPYSTPLGEKKCGTKGSR